MKLLTKEILEKMPSLNTQEDNNDPMVICKFFYPDFHWTWYVIAGEPSVDIFGDPDFEFFGYVVGDEPELGFFTVSELVNGKGKLGMSIERDRYFKPCPLSKLRKLHEQSKEVNKYPYTAKKGQI